MTDDRHTDIQMPNPSTERQRLLAARRQARGELADDERLTYLRVGDKGTQMGDDSTLWWPVTYGVARDPSTDELG